MSQIDLPPDGGPLAESSDDESCVDLVGSPRALAAHAVAQGNGAIVAPMPPLSQVDLLGGGLLVEAGSVAKRPVYAQRSPELLAIARQVRATKLAESKLQSAVAAASDANATITLVATVLPGANALLGGAVKRRRLQQAGAVPNDFAGMVLAVHLPCRQDLRVGVKRKRLVAAMARFLIRRQEGGLAKVFGNAKTLVDAATTGSRR